MATDCGRIARMHSPQPIANAIRVFPRARLEVSHCSALSEIDRLDVYLNQMKKDDKLQLQKDQDKYLINFINITSGYLREVGVVSQEELLKERAHSKQIHPCKS